MDDLFLRGVRKRRGKLAEVGDSPAPVTTCAQRGRGAGNPGNKIESKLDRGSIEKREAILRGRLNRKKLDGVAVGVWNQEG